jgi:hypothetical protein
MRKVIGIVAAHSFLVALSVFIASEGQSAPALASPPPPGSPAKQAPGSCVPSEKTPCGANMSLVYAAWSSPDALWHFLTSPSTGVPERRVAVSKADQIIPVDWLPKIIDARRDLLRERALYNLGIAFDPRNAYLPPFQRYESPRDAVGSQINRTILGYPFVVPEQWIPFPPTDDDLKRVWPAQVSDALDTLYWNMIADADPDRLDSEALSLPCTDYQTAFQIVEITTRVARRRHFASPEVFRTWMNITGANVSINRASVGILGVAASLDNAREDNWAMAQVLGLEALQTNDSSITYPAIDSMRNFRPAPYTFALAVARYLVSSKDLASNRMYEADILLRAIGESPLGAPTSYDQKKTAKYEQLAARFADWLRQNEASLQAKANLESPRIDASRKKMSVATACRPLHSHNSETPRLQIVNGIGGRWLRNISRDLYCFHARCSVGNLERPMGHCSVFRSNRPAFDLSDSRARTGILPHLPAHYAILQT